MLSDLWGSPPEPWRKNTLADWTTNDSHIFLEKELPSQIYRRRFRYMPGGQLAQLRTGAARSEHLPWASLREPLRAAPPRETRAFRVCVRVDGGSAFRVEPPEVQVEVAPNETVGQLKARLADMLCLQNAQLRLLWRCVGLPDRKALAACGPEHGSELELKICAGRAASASRAGSRPAALSGSLRLAASSTSRSGLRVAWAPSVGGGRSGALSAR
mmetsp:Transcript_81658/g.239739  ORF Transcript_81658/g.239739 Transcript_81658/m.239739 type:complete len:215 (+) Transcript_81658:111-755(+)